MFELGIPGVINLFVLGVYNTNCATMLRPLSAVAAPLALPFCLEARKGTHGFVSAAGVYFWRRLCQWRFFHLLNLFVHGSTNAGKAPTEHFFGNWLLLNVLEVKLNFLWICGHNTC